MCGQILTLPLSLSLKKTTHRWPTEQSRTQESIELNRVLLSFIDSGPVPDSHVQYVRCDNGYSRTIKLIVTEPPLFGAALVPEVRGPGANSRRLPLHTLKFVILSS